VLRLRFTTLFIGEILVPAGVVEPPVGVFVKRVVEATILGKFTPAEQAELSEPGIMLAKVQYTRNDTSSKKLNPPCVCKGSLTLRFA
jgi:hypothetical protein